MALLDVSSDGTRAYGPYVSSALGGRKIVVFKRADGSKTSTLYSRWKFQKKHGVLPRYIHVDHKNDNKFDDRLSNLQSLTAIENIAKSRLTPEVIEFKCPVCKKKATKLARHVRHNRNQGKAGPFCGKRCARLFQISGA